MVRWIAFMLCFLFILPAFADKKKKTENIQELDEKTRLEFDYSFMEGVRSKITGDYQALSDGSIIALKSFLPVQLQNMK